MKVEKITIISKKNRIQYTDFILAYQSKYININMNRIQYNTDPQ